MYVMLVIKINVYFFQKIAKSVPGIEKWKRTPHKKRNICELLVTFSIPRIERKIFTWKLQNRPLNKLHFLIKVQGIESLGKFWLYLETNSIFPCFSFLSLRFNRYDVRGALHDLTPYESIPGGYGNRLDYLSEAERKAELLCEEERYYSLFKNEVEEELYKGQLKQKKILKRSEIIKNFALQRKRTNELRPVIMKCNLATKKLAQRNQIPLLQKASKMIATSLRSFLMLV